MKRFIVQTATETKEIKSIDLLDAALKILDEMGISITLHPAEVTMQKYLEKK